MKFPTIPRKGALFGCLALGTAFVLSQAVFKTEAGHNYVVTNNTTGELKTYTEPGIHFRWPFLSHVEDYKQYATVDFAHEQNDEVTASRTPIDVRFADTYSGQIPAAFRVQLPTDPVKMEAIHRAFRTFPNLVNTLYVKTTRDVVVNTATQYTGEEFFQGGLNSFKAALADQLENGVYKTERRQVEIEQSGLAAIGLDQRDANKVETQKQLVWKTVPVTNAEGKFIRMENPFAEFGIRVDQVTITNPVPEPTLDTLLADKKKLVADRIRAVQEQETAREQAKTEQIKKEIVRTRETQDALKKKDLAVIAEQQQVEVAEKQAEKEKVEARKVAELALISKQKEIDLAEAEKLKAKADKERELAVAEANLAIQQAEYEAAVYEAKAIRERGLAKADVTRAQYEAFKPQIYLAEIERDIANVFYPSLKDFKVEMPQNLITSGDSANAPGLSNLDILTNLTTVQFMKGLKKESEATEAK